MPPAKPAGPKKSHRRPRCTYTEKGRRCPRNGTGSPSLCPPHAILIADAARPADPVSSQIPHVHEAYDQYRAGKPVDVRTAFAGIAELLGVFFGGAPPPPGPQFTPFGAGSPFAGFGFNNPPPPRPGAPRPPPRSAPPDPGLAEERRARQIFGFEANQVLTEDMIRKRKRELARKHHPDLGGSKAMMEAVNTAGDVLIARVTAAR